MTDGGTTTDSSVVLKKRFKRVGKVLRQIDVIKEKLENGQRLNNDQQTKLNREQELREQCTLLEEIQELAGLERRETYLAKENKKLNKKLRQIADIEKKYDQAKLNPDQQKKVGLKTLYVKQQGFYADLLEALRSEANGGKPVPLTANPQSAQTEAEAEPAEAPRDEPEPEPESPEAAEPAEEAPAAEEAPEKESPKEEVPQEAEMKSPETIETPVYASPIRPPAEPDTDSSDEDQSGSAPNDEEDGGGSDDSQSAPSTAGEDTQDKPAPTKTPSMEYHSVMRAVHTRPQEPEDDDSDASESQEQQVAAEARAPEEPEIVKQPDPVLKPVEQDDVEDAPLAQDYVLVSPVTHQKADGQNVEALREQARKNIANTKIAALKKDFWLQFQHDQMEPIEPWHNTPDVVRKLFQFLHVHECHQLARVNKTFAGALNAPESYDTLTAVPAFRFGHFFQTYPERYTQLKTIQCLRCAHQQLNDQRFWTPEVNEASARAIKGMANTCKSVENIVFGYLSCPEMYQLLCANSETLKKLQIYESKVLQPQGRIPDSLDLPQLEEMVLVNSGFEYWQAVSNLKYLSFSHQALTEGKTMVQTLSDIGRFCRQLEAFEVVYPPQSLSDKVIEEVVRWNETTLRALHITCQPRLVNVPTSHRQLSTELLSRIFSCRKLEILVIDGRLTAHNIWMLVDALPRLRILEFSGAGVTENGVKMIVQHCGNLQLLSLTGCEPNAVQRIRESGDTPSNLQVTAYPIISPQPGSLKRYLDMRNVPNFTGAVSTVPVKTPIPSTSQTIAPVRPVVQKQVEPPAQFQQPPTSKPGIMSTKPPGIPIPHGISAEPTDYEMGAGITYSTPPAQDAPW